MKISRGIEPHRFPLLSLPALKLRGFSEALGERIAVIRSPECLMWIVGCVGAGFRDR
ncbi:MAG: hypothetical protein WCD53_02255 [Microcoleus sp.]